MCPSDECSSPLTAQGDVHSIPFSTAVLFVALLQHVHTYVHIALDLLGLHMYAHVV